MVTNLAHSKKIIRELIRKKRIAEFSEYISSDEKKLIIEEANRLLKQIFVFEKTWDMERCSTPFRIEPLDFRVQRNKDPEWCYMLNRMDYLSYLMLAGILTNDEKYYLTGKKFVLEWIGQHPQLTPEASTRTLDTGIRLMNFFEALPFLFYGQVISDEELQKISDSLYTQILYLKDQYLPKYTLSNWGSIQISAMLSVFPLVNEDFKADEIFKWGIDEVANQCEMQIFDDGVQWEQSTMYHVEVLNFLMKLVYYHKVFAFPIDKKVEDTCRKMCDALFYQATPDWQIDNFGDSDYIVVRDVFTKGAVLFDEPTWKFGAAEKFDIESLYSFGCKFADDFAQIPAAVPAKKNFDGKDSGIYCVRSDWSKNANFTQVSNGSLGSGHGHGDNLHFSLYYQGQPYLVDSGRFTYRDDHPLRVELKRMSSHNSLVLDNREMCIPESSWEYRSFGLPLKSYVRHMDGVHYFEGTLLGSSPIQVWTRKLIVIDCGIWVIADEVRAQGKHEFKQYFHLAPNKSAHMIENGFRLVSKQNRHSLLFENEGRKKVEKKSFSPYYNHLLEHDVMTFAHNFEDQGAALTTICPDYATTEKPEVIQYPQHTLKNTQAEAVKFKFTPAESYTVVIFHEEIFTGEKLGYVENQPLYGKALVIHEVNGNRKTMRLKV